MEACITLSEVKAPSGLFIFDVEVLVDYDAVYERARFGSWEDSSPAHYEMNINSVVIVDGDSTVDSEGNTHDAKDVASWALEQCKDWIVEKCWDDFFDNGEE